MVLNLLRLATFQRFSFAFGSLKILGFRIYNKFSTNSAGKPFAAKFYPLKKLKEPELENTNKFTSLRQEKNNVLIVQKNLRKKSETAQLSAKKFCRDNERRDNIRPSVTAARLDEDERAKFNSGRQGEATIFKPYRTK